MKPPGKDDDSAQIAWHTPRVSAGNAQSGCGSGFPGELCEVKEESVGKGGGLYFYVVLLCCLIL